LASDKNKRNVSDPVRACSPQGGIIEPTASAVGKLGTLVKNKRNVSDPVRCSPQGGIIEPSAPAVGKLGTWQKTNAM